MIKITKIGITNYRAFFNSYQDPGDKYEMEIAGKNLLVYGENGSGKSSLFHALSDFFESAENAAMNIEENIFTEGEADLPEAKIAIHFIEKALYEGKETIQQLEFSRNAATTTGDTLLKEANKAFLSYREMLKTYFLAIHDKTQNPNLFDLFIEKLLSRITDEATNNQIKTVLQEIESDVVQFEQIVQDIIDSSEDITSDDTEQIRQEQKEKIEQKIKTFNESMTANLTDTIELVNQYLKQYFKVNIQVSLKNKDNYVQLDTNLNIQKVLLFDIEYFGKKLENKAYQMFLNEARLSALSVCLYLAAIKNDRPAMNNYKILFLDDIFIGLDMSNRLPLLEILKTEFADFQIFMTTYDRAWFETARQWFTNKAKKEWKFFEMYVDDFTNGFDTPVILETQTHLKKAAHYLAKHDYPACGSYLRKACEELLEKLLKPHYYKAEIKEGEERFKTTAKKLNALVVGLEAFCKEESLDYTDFSDLGLYKDALLNP